jgi:hypothetical protein
MELFQLFHCCFSRFVVNFFYTTFIDDSILPIFMSLCVNAQIKLKGVRLYSNTYYYELKDVFVDTKGEQFTLESMRIMFYSPNGSDITVAIQIPGEAPIFMKVDDTKEEPLYDGYNKVGKLLKTLCSGQKCDWNIDFGYTASTTSAVDPTVIKIMNKIGSFMGVIDESSIKKIYDKSAKATMEQLKQFHESFLWKSSLKKENGLPKLNNATDALYHMFAQ